MNKSGNECGHNRNHDADRGCQCADRFPKDTGDATGSLHLSGKVHDPDTELRKALHRQTDRTDRLADDK